MDTEDVDHGLPPVKRQKKAVVEDEDTETSSLTEKVFGCRLKVDNSFSFRDILDTDKSKRVANKPCPIALCCDITSISDLGDDFNTAKFSHVGVCGLRCSKSSPHICYSSSEKEASIFQWDIRSDARKPAAKFQLGKEFRAAGKAAGAVKSITAFDVDQNDRLVCGGTELVDDDCFVLFWDARSCKLLGTYSESHSNDITSLVFAPNSNQRIASGSTDGLMNLFDITAASEDDALLYSFNTESSVDSIAWGEVSTISEDGKQHNLAVVYCSTHTNDIIAYDVESGEIVHRAERDAVTKAIQRKNPEALRIVGCYTTMDNTPRVLCSSLAGSCTRTLLVKESNLVPSEWFEEPASLDVVHCAQPFHKSNHWITFYESSACRKWQSC